MIVVKSRSFSFCVLHLKEFSLWYIKRKIKVNIAFDVIQIDESIEFFWHNSKMFIWHKG
jgi:hypothetical protein